MAFDIGAKIGIEGEAQFKQSLKSINSAVKANSTALKAYTAEYDTNEKSLKNIRQENKLLEQTIQSNQEKVKSLTAEYGRQEAKLKELETAMERAKRLHGENSDEAIKAENAYSRQAQSVNNLESQINNANAEINTFTKRLQENGNAATYAGEKIAAAGDKISGVGTVLTTGVTLPLAAVGIAGLKVAKDFEAGMSQVKAISQATGSEFDALRDQAIDLGASTAFSSADVATAMTEMAKAGWSTQQILDGMGGVLDAAAASGEDLGAVSTIVADAITGFGLKAADSTRVADLLTQAANAGTIGIADLGETFKYAAPLAQSMGYSIEDVTTAVAGMSMAGIKGSQAGTALRTMFTNMAKPSKNMAVAMEVLGISLYDTQGKMYSMKDMIDHLRTSFSGFADVNDDYFASMKDLDALYNSGEISVEAYTQSQEELARTLLSAEDAEKAKYAAMLAGKEGMSGLLSLVNLSKEQYDALSESMYKSGGVAKETAEIMQDNLENKVEQLGGAAESLAIRLGEYVIPALTDTAIGATELVEAFTDLNPEAQQTILKMAGIAIAAGPTIKVVGTLTKGVGNLTSYMGKTVGSLKSGGDAATGLASVLKFAASPAGGITLAAVGVAALGTAAYLAMKKAKEAAIQADLDSHFGKIKLSAEEVEKVVAHLTETDWTVRVNSVIEEKNKLSDYEKELADTVANLNKMDWIVKYGMEIDAGNYQAEIDNYIQNAKDYAQQKGYVVDIAIQASFSSESTTGQGLSAFASGYYGEAYSQLDSLGTQLADIVNESFANNTFAQNRVKIEQIRQQMAEIIQEINKYDLGAAGIDLSIALNNMDIRMDADSFKRISAEVNEAVSKFMESSKESQKEVNIAISAQYEMMLDGGIDKATADKWRQEAIEELQIYYMGQEAELRIGGLSFSVGEIQKNFYDEISQAAPQMKTTLEEIMGNAIKEVDLSAETIDPSALFNTVKLEFLDGFSELGDTTKGAMKKALEGMQPQINDMQALADKYREVGIAVPQEIAAGLADAYQLEVMTGNIDHIYQLAAMQMADSPEYLKLIEGAEDLGMGGIEAFIQGIEMQNGTVYDATTNTWNEVSQSTADMAPKMAAEMNENGTKIGDSIAAGLAEQYGLVYDNGMWLILGASDGAYSALPGVLNVLAAAGVDIPDALIAAMSGKTAEIQNQAALLLTELSTATEEQRPEILEKLAELGIEVPETLVEALQSQEDTLSAKGVEIGNLISESTKKGIEGKESEVKTAGENVAKSGMTAMQGVINGTTLTGPNIDGNNTVQSATRAMYATLTEMQRTANRNPIIIPVMQGLAAGVTAGLSARQSADGGVFDSPTLTWIGETNQKEYIIPVERTAAAVPLLESAAADMGYTITKQSNYAAEAGRAMSQINHIRNDNRMVLNIQNFNNNSDRDLDSITDYMEKRVLRSTMQQKRKGG